MNLLVFFYKLSILPNSFDYRTPLLNYLYQHHEELVFSPQNSFAEALYQTFLSMMKSIQ